MSKVKKRYTLGEVRTILGITEEELFLMIKKLFPGFNKLPSYRFTENEFSQIKATLENNSMCDVNQKTCSDMVWRACWPNQVASFENKDLSGFNPTTEMTGNPYLGGKPCLIFSHDRTFSEGFLKTRKGGRLLELCLDNIAPDEWQIWDKTQDIHVLVEAVFREGKLVDV